MVFIAFASFPYDRLKEAAKVFLALKPLPASIKRRGPYFKIIAGAAIEVVTLYEFDPAFNSKAEKFLASRYKPFTEVPGFSVAIENRLDLQEAVLKLQINPP